MIVVGESLRQLIAQHGICSSDSWDGDSIALHLGHSIRRPKKGQQPIKFQQTARESLFTQEDISEELLLGPGDICLAHTVETITMPSSFIGLILATSTANRDFLSVEMGASKVSSGWRGVLTLELANNGPFDLLIPIDAHIAQLLVLTTTDDLWQPAPSRYQGAGSERPAIRRPRRA